MQEGHDFPIQGATSPNPAYVILVSDVQNITPQCPCGYSNNKKPEQQN